MLSYSWFSCSEPEKSARSILRLFPTGHTKKPVTPKKSPLYWMYHPCGHLSLQNIKIFFFGRIFVEFSELFGQCWPRSEILRSRSRNVPFVALICRQVPIDLVTSVDFVRGTVSMQGRRDDMWDIINPSENDTISRRTQGMDIVRSAFNAVR
jgi:hypothetical protein